MKNAGYTIFGFQNSFNIDEITPLLKHRPLMKQSPQIQGFCYNHSFSFFFMFSVISKNSSTLFIVSWKPCLVGPLYLAVFSQTLKSTLSSPLKFVFLMTRTAPSLSSISPSLMSLGCSCSSSDSATSSETSSSSVFLDLILRNWFEED